VLFCDLDKRGKKGGILKEEGRGETRLKKTGPRRNCPGKKKKKGKKSRLFLFFGWEGGKGGRDKPQNPSPSGGEKSPVSSLSQKKWEPEGSFALVPSLTLFGEKGKRRTP